MSKKESPTRPAKTEGTHQNVRQSPQSRREALQLLGVTGVSLLVGCGSDGSTTGGVAGSGGASGGAGGATGGSGGASGGTGGASGGAGGSTGGVGGSTGGAGGSTGGAAGSGGATGGTGGAAGATGGAAGKGGAAGAAGSTGGAAGKGGAAGAAGGTAGNGGAAGTSGGAGGTAGTGGAAGSAGLDAGPGGVDAAADIGGGGGFDAGACPSVDTPHVNVGPYYYDSMLNRSDVTEGKPGVPIEYRFTVLDANCKPIAGAVVDIWACDIAGIYSAYASQGTSGQLWLRGFQITDAHGQAIFKSIYPGWYSGRLTHLHGKIFLNGVQKDTTNFFFPKAIETAVYNSPLYASRGQNSVTVAQDVELKGDTTSYNELMMTVTGDVTNGYVASYVIKYS